MKACVVDRLTPPTIAERVERALHELFDVHEQVAKLRQAVGGGGADCG